MLGQYSHLFYTLTFTLIPIIILWITHFKILAKNIKIILITTFFGVFYAIIVDHFAMAWNAWFFNNDKILGFRVFGFPVEDFLFFILVPWAISSAVVVFIHHQSRWLRL